MTFLPRPIIAACGFACLIPTAPGCDAPPSEPRASASRLPDGRGSDPIPVDPIPVDPIPVDPIPVDPIPVDPIPVDPIPVDPGRRPPRRTRSSLPPGVDRAALATGTVALFDGRTLFGWEVDEPGFVVRSDELRVSGPTEARITTTMSFPTGVGRLQFEQTAGKGVVVEIHQRPGEASYTMGKAFGSPGERPLPWTEVTMELRRDRVAILSENRGSASGKGPQPPVRLHLAGVLGTGFRNVLYRPDTAPLPLTTFTPVSGNAAKVTRENDELRLTGGPRIPAVRRNLRRLRPPVRSQAEQCRQQLRPILPHRRADRRGPLQRLRGPVPEHDRRRRPDRPGRLRGRLRHRSDLPPAAGPVRQRGRRRVVPPHAGLRRQPHGDLGERVAGDRLHRRPRAAPQPPQRAAGRTGVSRVAGPRPDDRRELPQRPHSGTGERLNRRPRDRRGVPLPHHAI